MAVKSKITKVFINDDDPEEIVIQLDNGNNILFKLKPKLNEPLFAEIKELSQPKTDGERIYWYNGASIGITEIMEIIREEG